MSNDVTNLRDTILAKSDQLNADDIIGTLIYVWSDDHEHPHV